MSIFSRLADIVNSNLNAMLDRAEDPEKLVRLMIVEMEDTLIDVRATAARIIADKKDVHRRLERASALVAEWQSKAELAVSRGREELARAALVEKARVAQLVSDLESERGTLEDALAKQEEDIGRLEEKLREARAKQKSIQTRLETASSRLKMRRQMHDGRIDDALARYADLERRVDRTEGEVEAYDLGRGRTLAEEFAELEGEAEVEAELAAIKQRIAGAGRPERS